MIRDEKNDEMVREMISNEKMMKRSVEEMIRTKR
jgi:hypothetical protein